MDFSGGILLLIGAGLWLAYLFPTLVRGRVHEARSSLAEDAAHSLRILTAHAADDSAASAQARAEASPRAIVMAQRQLRRAHRREVRETERELVKTVRARRREARIARREARRDALDTAAARSRRKRARQIALTIMLGCASAAAVILLWSDQFMWPYGLVVGGGLSAVAVGALGALMALAARTRAIGERRARLSAKTTATAEDLTARGRHPVPVHSARAQAPSRSWRPRPLPRALQLEPGSQAALILSQREALEAFRRRALESGAWLPVGAPLPRIDERGRVPDAAPAAAMAKPENPSLRAAEPSVDATLRAVTARYASGEPAQTGPSTINVTDLLRQRRAV